MTARKLMLLGEIGVGKSSLVRRLVFDTFDISYKPTIGVDIYRYDVPDTPQRPGVSLVIWDTDGNFGASIFKHIYMRHAQAAMIVADISRPETLSVQQSLALGFQEHFPGRPVAFVVNKMDLAPSHEPIVLPPHLTEAEAIVAQTSAKTGHDVHAAFQSTADAIVRRNL
jgi:small GTP-binding protein